MFITWFIIVVYNVYSTMNSGELMKDAWVAAVSLLAWMCVPVTSFTVLTNAIVCLRFC